MSAVVAGLICVSGLEAAKLQNILVIVIWYHYFIDCF